MENQQSVPVTQEAPTAGRRGDGGDRGWVAVKVSLINWETTGRLGLRRTEAIKSDDIWRFSLCGAIHSICVYAIECSAVGKPTALSAQQQIDIWSELHCCRMLGSGYCQCGSQHHKMLAAADQLA